MNRFLTPGEEKFSDRRRNGKEWKSHFRKT
jgi:hypothetical protein